MLPSRGNADLQNSMEGNAQRLQRAVVFGSSVMNALMLWRGQAKAKPAVGFIRHVLRSTTAPPGAAIVPAVRPHRPEDTDDSLMTQELADTQEPTVISRRRTEGCRRNAKATSARV
jgi:hypothetical protein